MVALSGVCRDSETGEALPFAAVKVAGAGVATLTDFDGRFRLSVAGAESYTLSFSCLNYADREMDVRPDGRTIDVALDPQTYALGEVKVMADYDPQKGSAAVVSQQALELIQPTSVADALTLMPGGLYSQQNATGFNRISLRQSGSDDNTSLGMAVVMDGVCVDNDGFRSQLSAMSDEDEYASRLGWNKGVDLKTLSTDHVQRIEVIKGISSAKWGNLSSGVMQLSSKVGETPLQIRLKADPLTKLVYAGKGFRLPGKAGSLHAGVDFTSVYDDRRDPLSKYSRLTAQMTWGNTIAIAERSLFLFARLSETYTLNQAREDELIEERNESFENKYSRTTLMLKARIDNLARWVDNLELVASADYTFDRLDRNRYVQLNIPSPSPVNSDEGEHEAIFLPTTYYSPFYIENKPLTSVIRLDAESLAGSRTVQNKVAWGAQWRVSKNYGVGVSVDMSRPPYPDDSEYVRPTPNNQIPALSVGSAYVEDQLRVTSSLLDITISAGGRFTKMFNLASAYHRLRRAMAEPRINLAFASNFDMRSGRELRLMLRGGFGEECKLPTLDFIYPDPVYKDYTMLSAYTSRNSPFNHIIVDTRIYDVTNYDLAPNRNRKFEVGADAELADFKLSLTLFRESTDDGFGTVERYVPVSYKRYFTPATGDAIVDRRPEKSDYIEETYNNFANMPVVRNCMMVKKKGLEYRLVFPKIAPISTSVEVNGAYYTTDYGQNEPDLFHPVFKDDGKPQPYVGVYRLQDINRQRTLNTNVWFNTNIPRLKMVFSTFFQLVWLSDKERINGDELPSEYYSFDGVRHEVTDEIRSLITSGDVTWRHYHIYKEDYYEKQPFSLMANFKLTKEFNRHIKAAFFVNGIADVAPNYKNRYGQNSRTWNKPFFGAEMTIALCN